MNELNAKKNPETTVTVKFWALVGIFAVVLAFIVTVANTNTNRIVRLETAMEAMQASSTRVEAMVTEVRVDIKNLIHGSNRRDRDRRNDIMSKQ